ncbi:unnamed protein product [Paramecium sonneborni]|uniref:Uncharacterized protein n=1 Tax=Paramecium sonneborni TaxID=65129 RepID=A0A8S1QXL3_9CILI|nr:unnamed protein product [Paramecium sonneborni]
MQPFKNNAYMFYVQNLLFRNFQKSILQRRRDTITTCSKERTFCKQY